VTPIKPSQRIRKVWLPTEMKTAMQEYCWRHRTKPSPFISEIIREIIADPNIYAGLAVPPAGLDYSSVYVDDETWEKGSYVAEAQSIRLGAMVRVGIAKKLEEESIPWSVTTPRPQNRFIPAEE
jgi:hypothetical protein